MNVSQEIGFVGFLVIGSTVCSNSHSLPHIGKPVLSHSLYALKNFVSNFIVVGCIFIR